jgi:hypothetical protein
LSVRTGKYVRSGSDPSGEEGVVLVSFEDTNEPSNSTDNALFSADNVENSTDNVLLNTNNPLSSTDKLINCKDTSINTEVSLNVESLLHEINYDIDVKISNIITTKNDDNSINNNHINNCDDNNSISNNDDKDKNNDDNNGNDMDSVDNILQTGELLEALSRGESESTLFGSIGQLCIYLHLCLFIYTYVCTHIVLLDALQNYVQNIRIK